ncbi:hypothetical protein EJB05_14138, partial [Eragrostis curvula]
MQRAARVHAEGADRAWWVLHHRRIRSGLHQIAISLPVAGCLNDCDFGSQSLKNETLRRKMRVFVLIKALMVLIIGQRSELYGWHQCPAASEISARIFWYDLCFTQPEPIFSASILFVYVKICVAYVTSMQNAVKMCQDSV